MFFDVWLFFQCNPGFQDLNAHKSRPVTLLDSQCWLSKLREKKSETTSNHWFRKCVASTRHFPRQFKQTACQILLLLAEASINIRSEEKFSQRLRNKFISGMGALHARVSVNNPLPMKLSREIIREKMEKRVTKDFYRKRNMKEMLIR